ncbi:MAG: FadR family transcriptional regulator [Deltaproteobacteria bacterium]|nr:FadR family transcriptional regulator [Deltaproteobacteria bacterium]MBW2016536.1 FadR family transcriptional regulator [Deltaproteobacteria bacterium]MBW2128716.1 FadR family transcriptional regulator [Deltaproteobacteria bacterium]MBW2302402.1 FadR family transcriptional regulator [Deltaproteobacteria bacterium]
MAIPEKKSSHPFRSIAETKLAHEKIVDQIRNAIFERKLRPGEKLPTERQLADIFKTSRVTVRSALLTLKNGGLLEVKQGKNGGAFVAEDIGEAELARVLRDIIGLKGISIDHVIEVRLMIEPQIAYLAAKNADQSDIETIWATIQELDHLFREKSTFRSSDENFHKALARAAKNPMLTVFQASLIDVLFKFIYTIAWKREHKENILNHHRKIAEKIEERSPEAAREAMVEHLSDMKRILSQLPTAKTLEWFR